MFYVLITWLQGMGESIGAFRVLKYISFRSAISLLLAFIIGALAAPVIIRKLRRMKMGQQILKIEKSDGVSLPDKHNDKKGLPTMGGVIIVLSFLIPVILFGNISNPLVLMLISMTVGFGLVGFADDYMKIKGKDNSAGLSPKMKLVCQLLLGMVVGIFLKMKGDIIVYSLTSDTGGTHLSLPFIKDWYPQMGWFFVPYAMIVITATSNAVNLTDGLDGLAIGTVMIVAASYAVLAYLVGRPDFSQYLMVPYVNGAGEITVFLAAMIGASAAFLWFNANPAQIFMGDTGSLSLGGLIGTIALFLKQEILLFIIGGIFVIEAASVIIQVGSYRYRNKKRVFLMAPIHHHFEKKGIPEPKIIARFWIVAALLALAGLTTLKLR